MAAARFGLASEVTMAASTSRPIRFSLRGAKSASAATGSAGAFLLLSAALSFVPDQPAAQSTAWHLRGTLAQASSARLDPGPTGGGLHAPAGGEGQTSPPGLPPVGKPV